VRSVHHAIDVLQHLSEADGPLGVSDLARLTKLNKATVFHLLSTLQSRHLVTQDPQTCRYQLSWGLYALGASVTRTHDVARAVRGRLEPLAQATGETVLVGILDEGTVLYLDRAESPSGLAMVANIGRRAPLHAVATGKVLLAHADAAQVESVLGSQLPAFTPATVTDPAELRRQLELARDQGYARCWQEHEAGVSSISVPIRDYTGQVVSALTIAGPATRLTSRAVRRQLVPLREAAASIASRLGGVQPSGARNRRKQGGETT
jgi:DNA-binding IclR family transcriptional regulator